LADALRDPDALVRREAVLAVAKLSAPGDGILSQLKTMNDTDRDSTVRDYALKALRHFDRTP
jgi:hypothetical protein